jgi:hypothetical protein
MANPFNPYANSVFARAYLDTTDTLEESPFNPTPRSGGSGGRESIIKTLQDPSFGYGYNADIGPSKALADFPMISGITQPSTDYLAGIFSSPIQQPDILSKGFLPSSSTAMQATSLNPAKNAAQRAEGGASSLVRAMQLISSMSGGKEKAPDQGIPLPGSESTKLKYSASGVPFYTTSVSARDESGKFKERTEFDLSGQPVKTRGDIMEGMNKPIQEGKQSWEQPRINPYLGTSF